MLMVNLRMDATVVKESMMIQWACEVRSKFLQTIFNGEKIKVFYTVETFAINQTDLANAFLRCYKEHKS